jgi:hypothetical protein
VVRIPDIKSDPVLSQLADAWKRCDCIDDQNAIMDWDIWFPDILRAANGLSFFAKHVESFSLLLASFQDDPVFQRKAGLYLSALINACPDEEFIIHTRHLSLPPDSFGYQNTKNVIVEGNLGKEAGDSMISGSIIVKGNVGHCAGDMMRGGEIMIEGDAGANVGTMMNGGRIIVQGHAGHDAGFEMNKGVICLDGTYDGISSNIYGGRIFHKNEMIFHEK